MAHWTESSGPPPIPDRVQFLAEQARGKRVLDLGVMSHSTESTVSANWLNDLVQAAESCLGLDILAPAYLRRSDET